MLAGGALRGMNDAVKNNNKIRSKRKHFSSKQAKATHSKPSQVSPQKLRALKRKAGKNKADTKL